MPFKKVEKERHSSPTRTKGGKSRKFDLLLVAMERDLPLKDNFKQFAINLYQNKPPLCCNKFICI